MIRSFTFAAFAVATLAFSAPSALAQETAAPEKKAEVVRIAPKVKKGQVFYFAKSDTNNVGMPGQSMKTAVNLELVMTVTEVSEKGAWKSDVKIHRIFGSMDLAGMMSLDFDSNDPKKEKEEEAESDPFGGMMPSPDAIKGRFLGAAGETFKVEFDATGAVTNVSNFPASLAGGGMGGMMGGAPAPSQDQLRKLVGDPFLVFPAQGAAVGASFKGGKDTDKQSGMKTTMTHTIQSATDKEVAVKSKGKVEMGEGEGGLAQAGAEIEEATVRGKGVYSRTDGLPLSYERSKEIAMFMENEMMGELEIEMNSKATFKRVKGFAKKPAPKAADAKDGKDGKDGSSK